MSMAVKQSGGLLIQKRCALRTAVRTIMIRIGVAGTAANMSPAANPGCRRDASEGSGNETKYVESKQD
jgi:hypothetical protein